MSPEALGGGAFTWSRIQRLYDTDPAVHWQRCESEGLECPLEVFAQLSEDAHDADFAVVVRAIDWGRVRRELEEFSGVALGHVRVDRSFQYALDEARGRAAQFGIHDDRTEVVDHWRDARSWLAPPVMVSGEVLGTNIGYELGWRRSWGSPGTCVRVGSDCASSPRIEGALDDSFEDWERGALASIGELISIDVEALVLWCRHHGRQLDSAARAAYVTHLLQEAPGD